MGAIRGLSEAYFKDPINTSLLFVPYASCIHVRTQQRQQPIFLPKDPKDEWEKIMATSSDAAMLVDEKMIQIN